jgi:hypothetical protein
MGRRLIAAVALAAGLAAAPLVPAAAAPAPLGYVFRTFDVPGATGTQVNGVNDGGVIEGAFTDASGQHGFVVGPAGGDAPGQGTVITATNDQLTLAGFYITSSGADHGLIAHPR